MKEYFKYDNGFVNINDENLFLTNSGNWSETHDLLEKSPKSIRLNNFKSYKVYLFYLIVIVMVGFLINNIFKDIQNKSFPFGVIVLALSAFAYLRSETGKRYKIPLSKIQSITIIDKEAKIVFLNTNGVEDFEIIHKITDKGLSILNSLNLKTE